MDDPGEGGAGGECGEIADAVKCVVQTPPHIFERPAVRLRVARGAHAGRRARDEAQQCQYVPHWMRRPLLAGRGLRIPKGAA
eukprot:7199145-Prymnesium_polylepis.1